MFSIAHPALKTVLNVSSPFGLRKYGIYWWHNGIDYPCPINTPVYAVANGTVMNAKDGGTYGNYMDIWHGGAGSLYAHLSRFAAAPGQSVVAGQLIGYSGNTGDSTGPHLHFEIRLCRTYAEFWERCEKDSNVFMRCVDPQIFVDDYNSRTNLNVAQANTLVKNKAELNDSTMAFLSFYKYDKDLILKLAKAMI